MNKRNVIKFSIIGTGMVGTAIGFLLKKAGYKVTAISDKSPVALKRARSYIEGALFCTPQEAPCLADCILITTPDDYISSACREISLCPSIKNKFVFHMSGAGDLSLLESAEKAGALVGSIHPLQSFSSIDQAIQNIPGSYFAITADNKLKTPAKNIVRNLGGVPFFISSSQKPLYHAASCIASNYLVALLNTVESIYKVIGLNEKDAKKAFLPLVNGSLKNIEKSGSVASLTGPIARGDIGTIKKHIEAISKNLPQFSSLYSSLGLITVKIARRKGTLKAREAKEINAILKGVKNEHTKQN